MCFDEQAREIRILPVKVKMMGNSLCVMAHAHSNVTNACSSRFFLKFYYRLKSRAKIVAAVVQIDNVKLAVVSHIVSFSV